MQTYTPRSSISTFSSFFLSFQMPKCLQVSSIEMIKGSYNYHFAGANTFLVQHKKINFEEMPSASEIPFLKSFKKISQWVLYTFATYKISRKKGVETLLANVDKPIGPLAIKRNTTSWPKTIPCTRQCYIVTCVLSSLEMIIIPLSASTSLSIHVWCSNRAEKNGSALWNSKDEKGIDESCAVARISI